MSIHIAMLIMQASDNSATLASSREKFFWSGLWIYSLATGLASMIFMSWAFYVESVLGRGALFIEPNRVLAAGGISPVATGVFALFILFFPRPRRAPGFLPSSLLSEKIPQDKTDSPRGSPWGA